MQIKTVINSKSIKLNKNCPVDRVLNKLAVSSAEE